MIGISDSTVQKAANDIISRNSVVANAEISRIMNFGPYFGGEDDKNNGGSGNEGGSGDGNGSGSGTGGQGSAETDPIALIAADPEKIKELLRTNDQQKQDLQKVTAERDTFVQEKDKNERAQMNKEQQLQTDLDKANATIEQMDRVVQHVAKTSAFLNASSDANVQWNSVKQAMAELDVNNFDITVDLDNGTAEVVGMDKEIDRISKANTWLVKSAGDVEPNGGVKPPRAVGGGRPPAPPKGDAAKKARRDSMISRFPSTMQRSSVG
jgi:hypothetical protein